jgi:hypothetical protein
MIAEPAKERWQMTSVDKRLGEKIKDQRMSLKLP